MLSSLFSLSAAGEIPQIKSIELDGAGVLKPVDDLASSGAFFESMWEQQCLFHAVRAFVELRIADVMGTEMFTMDELAARCVVKNKRGLEALCVMLCKHNVLIRSGETVGLGPHGALLQQNLSTKYVDMLAHMADERVTNAWKGLSSSISDAGVSVGGEVDDAVMNLCCPYWKGGALAEVRDGITSLDVETDAPLKIGVWSLEIDIEDAQSIFPNANIYRIDGSEHFEVDTDLFIFHRTLTLFGIPDTIKRAAGSLREAGRVVVIDLALHPSLAADNLFMHAASMPELMSETDWTALLSHDFDLTSLKSVREGVVAILLRGVVRV